MLRRVAVISGLGELLALPELRNIGTRLKMDLTKIQGVLFLAGLFALR
jgi:hypothetical protein